MQCETCRFAFVRHHGAPLECRRYPPRIAPLVGSSEQWEDGRRGAFEVTTGIASYFPDVEPDEWCGEWSAR